MVGEDVFDGDRLAQKAGRTTRAHVRPDWNSVKCRRILIRQAGPGERMQEPGPVYRYHRAQDAFGDALRLSTNPIRRGFDDLVSGHHFYDRLLELRQHAICQAVMMIGCASCGRPPSNQQD
jgi:hypothetical protein